MTETFVPATGFSWLLPFYDPLVARFTCESKFKAHLLDRARLRPGLRLLDVGCGSGTLLSLAKRAEMQVRLAGIDVDAKILARANSKLAEVRSSVSSGEPLELELHTASATDLPCRDNRYDVVVSSLVFHHLTPHEKLLALREIHRVLVPGGKMLLADFGHATNTLAYLRFLSVRLLDGWCRTACNSAGRLPELIIRGGFGNPAETLVLSTPLGTLRCYEAYKP